jgi:hypothetical protein
MSLEMLFSLQETCTTLPESTELELEQELEPPNTPQCY